MRLCHTHMGVRCWCTELFKYAGAPVGWSLLCVRLSNGCARIGQTVNNEQSPSNVMHVKCVCFRYTNNAVSYRRNSRAKKTAINRRSIMMNMEEIIIDNRSFRIRIRGLPKNVVAKDAYCVFFFKGLSRETILIATCTAETCRDSRNVDLCRIINRLHYR